MIDFQRSFATWTIDWSEPDPVYKYPGGFVGEPGEETTSRMQLDASCEISEEAGGATQTLYLTAPCRSEFIIAREHLFQIPNSEFRAVVNDAFMVPIAKEISSVCESTQRTPVSASFREFAIDVHKHPSSALVESADGILEASLNGSRVNARSAYRDAQRQLKVTIEYPIKLINLHVKERQFQVCTGAVVLPDLATWDGTGVDRVFLAHVAFSATDHVEFILRRELPLAEHELAWAGQVRGRDRLERWNGRDALSDRSLPRATGYYETWALDATNTVSQANLD
jgi:hypothetical protein